MTAFNKAKWEAYQGLNDDDIMDAIDGSVAIPLAIKSGDWEYAFQFIKERIDNKWHLRLFLCMVDNLDLHKSLGLQIFCLGDQYF